MSVHHSTRVLRRTVQQNDLCSCFTVLSLSNRRSLSSTSSRNGIPTTHQTTRRDSTVGDSGSADTSKVIGNPEGMAQPSYKTLSPADRAAQAAQRARARMLEQQQKYAATRQLGGLADNSLFHEEVAGDEEGEILSGLDKPVRQRDTSSMSMAINPRPNARARWQRKMVIRHVMRRGRLPKKIQIERTERFHLSKSHFFKTSMKKLAPLARQIAGKSIDEAILQMRFSKKKAAIDVREHLIQARDEAIVYKGMGLPPPSEIEAQDNTSAEASVESVNPIMLDPAITEPLSYEHPTKTIKPGVQIPETKIYIAQAWVNRGPYGMEPEYRARGRVNMLRPPWTGISVLLKEEKTRLREKAEKEEKSIRKRVGKSMWTQLPDRPIVRQSQYVLW